MSDPYLGQIILMAIPYAPKGWNACDGSILTIQSNAALYALLGTYYGGNGTSTFALPDLRGRVPICAGSNPNLSAYNLGQYGGSQSVTLTAQNLAPHVHGATIQVTADAGRGQNPVPPANGNYLYTTQTVASAPTSPASLGGVSTQSTGNGSPFNILPPFLALNYYIALVGIFPPRP